MYLKCGIPVIINEIGEMSAYVRKYQLGVVAEKREDINPGNLSHSPDVYRSNCLSFYKEHLDFTKFSKYLLDSIEAGAFRAEGQIEKNDGSAAEIESYVNQMIALYNKGFELGNSREYAIGQCFYDVRLAIDAGRRGLRTFVKRMIGYESKDKERVFSEMLAKYFDGL